MSGCPLCSIFEKHQDHHADTTPKSLRNKFAKISTKYCYNTRLSAKECFSKTEKMKKSLIRIGVSICNSIPHSVLVKKIKSLLLIALDTEENYLNVTYLIEYFKKLT